jgi:hypothetical protein
MLEVKRHLQGFSCQVFMDKSDRTREGGFEGNDGLEALPEVPPVPSPFLCGGVGSGGGCLMCIGCGLFCIVYQCTSSLPLPSLALDQSSYLVPLVPSSIDQRTVLLIGNCLITL